MKKSIILSVVVSLVTAVLVATVFLSFNNVEKVERERPLVLSMTASADMPAEMMFADEKIIFDRYDIRERMDRELNSFTYFHSTTMMLIKRANRIFPIIEPILKENGMPDDLKYLAVIESNLDPRAISPARAAGLWQFMPTTGKEFGLEISSEVDERYHIEKSTVAASKYLRKAYNNYNSWSAAALSYNGGQGRITRELSNQKADNALDLLLVEETARYYYRMLAIKLIFENPKHYGFVLRGDQLYKPMTFKDVEVTASIPSLVDFAKEHGVTYSQLKDFNVWSRDTKLTVSSGKSYIFQIPTQESLFYKKGDTPKVHNPNWVVR